IGRGLPRKPDLLLLLDPPAEESRQDRDQGCAHGDGQEPEHEQPPRAIAHGASCPERPAPSAATSSRGGAPCPYATCSQARVTRSNGWASAGPPRARTRATHSPSVSLAQSATPRVIRRAREARYSRAHAPRASPASYSARAAVAGSEGSVASRRSRPN